MPRTSSKNIQTVRQAYVVTVDMGYGHQRASYPFRDIAACPPGCSLDEPHHIISANTYAGVPKIDQHRWERSRKVYEIISRTKKVPIIGDWIFGVMDYVQRIEPFYPKRDLSRPTLQLKQIYRFIKQGWGKHLIDLLNEKPLPLLTSFFIRS